jgi:hypothetical protein
VNSAEDAEHFEHPSTSKRGENMDQVKEVVIQNRRVTVSEFVNVFGISVLSVQSILEGNL